MEKYNSWIESSQTDIKIHNVKQTLNAVPRRFEIETPPVIYLNHNTEKSKALFS